jgi:urea transport system ATP-binding protein
MATPLLSVENVTVSFDGFNALDGISLKLTPTSVRVLIRPNGASKSTLLDAIIGHVLPTRGRVIFKGEDITNVDEYKIVRKGICRKFQAPGILESLTVADNLSLAARRHRECWRSFGTRVSPEVRSQVERVLGLIGLEEKRHSLAAHLSHGQKE